MTPKEAELLRIVSKYDAGSGANDVVIFRAWALVPGVLGGTDLEETKLALLAKGYVEEYQEGSRRGLRMTHLGWAQCGTAMVPTLKGKPLHR